MHCHVDYCATTETSSSPHRSSRQHLQRLGVQRPPISRTILATVDTLGDLVELACISQLVESLRCPASSCRHAAVLRHFQQLWVIDQVKAKRLATGHVVSPANYLDQATTTVLLTVTVSLWRVAQAFGE